MAYREGGNSNLSLKCRFYWLILSPMVSHPSYPCGNPVHRHQLFAKTNKHAQLDHLGYPTRPSRLSSLSRIPKSTTTFYTNALISNTVYLDYTYYINILEDCVLELYILYYCT